MKENVFRMLFWQKCITKYEVFFSSVKFKSFAPGASLTQKIREKQCKEQNATNCTVLFITLHIISFHKFFLQINSLWKLHIESRKELVQSIEERNFKVCTYGGKFKRIFYLSNIISRIIYLTSFSIYAVNNFELFIFTCSI